ncbi:MAG: methylmalonyl Co-A mutase-associated GTPase MeaB [Planctomycetota bacterium]|nr:methylmalonyl Co-A mutase-associated GTPase MeaB [Planctomycetota bacterium]
MTPPAARDPNDNARRRDVSLDEYVKGVRAGDRALMGRAITLIESNRPADQEFAEELLTRLMPHSGGSIRVGITGVPGVGKSTFIDTLGSILTEAGHRLAVLAVDPSSGVSGGSILGDKTRMPRLAVHANAFIRPSPSAGVLGGVARRTRETMHLCEAAGFDIVLVETVGVGQSETVVAEMTDFFLALMLPGAGDELQGIKRGLLELADMIVINKADGDNKARVEQAAREYRNVMHYARPSDGDWTPPVLTCSALTGEGIEDVWRAIVDRHGELRAAGELDRRRRRQALRWMQSMIDEQLRRLLAAHPGAEAVRAEVQAEVLAGRLPAGTGARRILDAFTAR